jgi:undecaprenyl diphosphate synthase
MNKMEEVEIKARGRVQGVNFRTNIKFYCDLHEIKGYVMNKEDGSLLAVAQGNSDEIESFINWIKSNPGLAKISDINVEKKQVKAKYSGFEVIREGNFFIDKAKSLKRLGESLIKKKTVSPPVHIAIIPDGNRRWAREKGIHGSFGHYTAGSKEHIKELIKETKSLGCRYLSLWGFSTENWKRDAKEIKAIFDLVLKNIDSFYELAKEEEVRFKHIGRKDRFPKELRDALIKLENSTKDFERFNVLLCLDYGGRDEIVRAVNCVLKSGKKEISETDFSNCLDTKGIPDPDLIIRTSGERRTSGFLAFQAVYAELYFTNKYFPEFNAADLREAVKSFGKRQRTFGGNA